MSEQRATYHAGRRTHLRMVKPAVTPEQVEQVNRDLDAGGEESEASREAAAILGNAVMHAAMSWVACCMEKQGESVEVMPLGGGLFDAEVRLQGGGSMWLKVRLILEAGPRLMTQIEPIHP